MSNRKRFLILVFVVLFLPISVYLVLRVTNFFQRALGTNANLVIDAGSSFTVPGGVWRNLGQGGEEKGRMLLPVVGKVKTLSPQYIRIDHVFDAYDVVARDGGGSLVFNWSNLDLTLGDILAIGAKPFISVSYMPLAISKSDIIDLPNSWGEWEQVVKALVEHVSGRGGLNLSNVYYEVWNEPDLFGKFKRTGEKNYLDLYAHTVTGANRATGVNPFKIGGPATTGFYRNWLNALLKLAQNNNLRLDFLSWHRYSKNIDDYEEDALGAKKLLEEFPGLERIELMITESGPNSENDPVYDGGFGAIHTLAVNTVLEGTIARNFSFEIKDGPGNEKYWGRWGILTHEKFGEPEAKPRFNALAFLNRMGGKKVNVAGTGSWVKAFAKEENGIIKTLVVNYDPAGKHNEAVPMTFINLSATNFTLRRIDFGGSSKDLPVATTSASWQTIQEFKPNTASIFEIIPLK